MITNEKTFEPHGPPASLLDGPPSVVAAPDEEYFARTLRRLIQLSNEDRYDPFKDLAWVDSLPEDEYWLSPDLMSVHGTPLAERLSREQRLGLSKWECLNFFSLNVTGIRELLMDLMSRIHTPGFEVPSEYFHHLVLEENEHMWFFSRFCLSYGGKIYKDRRIRAEPIPEADIRDFMAFATVLIFEEIVDVYNSHMASDASLPPFVREINRLHHADETRHIAYGRLNAARLHAGLRQRYDERRLAEIEQALKRFMLTSMQKLYNPEVYKDAGLPEPLKVRNALLRDPARVAFNEKVLSKTVRFFLKSGIIKDGALA